MSSTGNRNYRYNHKSLLTNTHTCSLYSLSTFSHSKTMCEPHTYTYTDVDVTYGMTTRDSLERPFVLTLALLSMLHSNSLAFIRYSYIHFGWLVLVFNFLSLLLQFALGRCSWLEKGSSEIVLHKVRIKNYRKTLNDQTQAYLK